LCVLCRGAYRPLARHDHLFGQPARCHNTYLCSTINSPNVEVTGNANSAIGVRADVYYNNGIDVNIFNAQPNTATSGGPTIYTGGAIGNTNTGNPTAAGAYSYNNGSDYTVELYAAPGFNAGASALVPVSQYTSYIITSSVLGGFFKSFFLDNDPGVPFAGADATVALFAWYNGGVSSIGLSQTTLSAQLAADQTSGMPWGRSPLDNVGPLGSESPPEGPPIPPADLQGLQSFSLTTLVVLPEPATQTLVMFALLVFAYPVLRRSDLTH